MGGINQSFLYWWNYFKSLFKPSKFDVFGTITVGPGMSEITVPASFPNPSAIYLNVTEPDDGVTTCLGNLNWVAVRLLDDSFIIYTNVTSASCDIHYVVQYDVEKSHPDKAEKPVEVHHKEAKVKKLETKGH